MKTKITHVGGGWYTISVTGHQHTMARGKINAIAKATKLEQTPATLPDVDIHNCYLKFIKQENNQ